MRQIAVFLVFFAAAAASAQDAPTTRADTLRGSITPERAWWDVTFYDLRVDVSPSDSSISGHVGIDFKVNNPAREMQIDLQAPMILDRVEFNGRAVPVRSEGDAHYAMLPTAPAAGSSQTVTAHFHGRPRVALRAPWDGGFVWTTDAQGRPWVATAVQGLGASAWWPNKDHQADEPDSQRVAITMPRGMMDVSNGRLRNTTIARDGKTTFEWFVENPINNYGIAVNAGSYAHWQETYDGEAGPLTLDFYPLDYNEEAARQQWAQAKPMLACFEHWFGPYPFYEDGFKLVETPHLGMEHQSAVAYGNGYQNGFRGRDLSGTGRGLEWDFILVHESGHEWFGNNITSKDVADMWVHEGFTNYSENLYTECQQGKEAGADYVIGTRALIENKGPIVGQFGVQREGTGDMYYKGGNMLHTLRQVVNDDDVWRGILRGLNSDFRHTTVTGRQVEGYISDHVGRDLFKVFDQYLTTTDIPVFEYREEGPTLWYRWTNVLPGFEMPVRIHQGGESSWLETTDAWQTATAPGSGALTVDRNWYVETRNSGS